MTTPLRIAADHPAYAGHFPQFPVLPGAVLLDEALHEIFDKQGLDVTRWRLTSVKFLGLVRPGDALTLEHSAPDAGTLRFAIRNAGVLVTSGTLSNLAASGDARHADGRDAHAPRDVDGV